MEIRSSSSPQVRPSWCSLISCVVSWEPEGCRRVVFDAPFLLLSILFSLPLLQNFRPLAARGLLRGSDSSSLRRGRGLFLATDVVIFSCLRPIPPPTWTVLPSSFCVPARFYQYKRLLCSWLTFPWWRLCIAETSELSIIRAIYYHHSAAFCFYFLCYGYFIKTPSKMPRYSQWIPI